MGMSLARSFALLLVGLAASAASAWADEEPVHVRTGDHPGFGRIVFDLHSRVPYRLTRDNDRIRLQFDKVGPIETTPSHLRNVLGITGGDGEAAIRIVPGARLRQMRMGNEVVIDILDPDPQASLRRRKQAAQPAPPPVPSAPPAPGTPSAPKVPTPDHVETAATKSPAAGEADQGRPLSASKETLPPSPAPAITPAPAQASGSSPPASVLEKTPDPPGQTGSATTLPFGPTTGLAVLRRGETLLLVFDERRPIDLSAFSNDSVFGAAAVQLLPEATVIRLRPPRGTELGIAHSKKGWTIAAGTEAPVPRPIQPVLEAGHIDLPASQPGSVVNVTDPETGEVLLVGTQREAGEGLPRGERAAQFALVPTLQGVAVEPLADNVRLRPTPRGFQLDAEPEGLAMSPPSAQEAAYADAARLTRRFDFPPLPTNLLQARLQTEIDRAAAAPPLGRAAPRVAAAKTLIALGLGAEAQSVLQLAAADAPAQADDADTIGLASLAAQLAGRMDETGGMDDPRLTGTDEIALWRALRDASRQEGAPAAAQVLAADLPLLLSYPPELRDRLLPLAVETMALNGIEPANGLLGKSAEAGPLALARAFLLDAQGKRAEAIALLSRLADNPDQSIRARAAARAVELRLASGEISAAQAADALDKQIYAWRGDERELRLRLRIAELRAAAGAWRNSLALLRETANLWPEQEPMLRGKMKNTFAALLSDHNADRLAPLDLVALIDENPDLLPEGEQALALSASLADRLLALDLPKRADPILAKLMASATGAARAAYGARLAALRLREGDPAAALSTLAASAGDGLPAEIRERRTLVQASALARQGNPGEAANLLAGLGSAAADEARATILENAKDWPQAARALADLAARTIPSTGALSDDQRRTLLRLAGATAQAGDATALAALRSRELARMEGGPLGEMFQLLTAGPVQGSTDLARAGREMTFARNLPTDLKAVAGARSGP